MAIETGIDMQTLAKRIVEAARLAASVHLYESLRQKSEHYGRRVMIGGAGPDTQGDHDSEPGSASGLPGRSAVVTDDEPAAHPPEAAGLSRRPPRYSPAD